MRHLPVLESPDPLDRIEIAVPCQVSWDTMAGDDRVRHCGQCRQNVYNIAGFTRYEAMRLIEEKQGRMCLRLFRRPDGTVLTANCRERLRAARKRGVFVFLGVAAVILWAQLCAQFLGLIGLRRVLGFDGGPVHGEAPMLGAPAPLDPPPPRIPEPEPRMVEQPGELFLGKPVAPPRHGKPKTGSNLGKMGKMGTMGKMKALDPLEGLEGF
jgi:hypothetical protein